MKNVNHYVTLILAFIFILPQKQTAQIIIAPLDPVLEVEIKTEGQTAIRGYNGPIGNFGLPPTDENSIGVEGVGFSGVKGRAISNLGYGVYGSTIKESGAGVYGLSSGEFSEGVLGEATGSAQTGVMGRAEVDFGYGIHGVGIGDDVRGVLGVCTNNSTGHGGYFIGGYGTYISPRLGVQNLTPDYPIHVGEPGGSTGDGNGAYCSGGGTWTNGSSISFKENFEIIEPLSILKALAKLDISRWNYISSDEGDHLGPMAEDFHKAFGLGNDPQYISTTDADGVALASIQALFAITQKQQAEISALRNALMQTKKKRIGKRNRIQ